MHIYTSQSMYSKFYIDYTKIVGGVWDINYDQQTNHSTNHLLTPVYTPTQIHVGGMIIHSQPMLKNLLESSDLNNFIISIAEECIIRQTQDNLNNMKTME